MDTQGQKASGLRALAPDANDLKVIRVLFVLMLMLAVVVFALVGIGAGAFVLWKEITAFA